MTCGSNQVLATAGFQTPRGQEEVEANGKGAHNEGVGLAAACLAVSKDGAVVPG
jgi:hypothetical protein